MGPATLWPPSATLLGVALISVVLGWALAEAVERLLPRAPAGLELGSAAEA